MICSVCGSEFSVEKFDICPYCLTPVAVEDNTNNETSEVLNEAVSTELTSTIEKNMNIEHSSTKNIELDDEYEVTEADLIEESEEIDSPDIMIDEIGLSVRAKNAFRRANIHTLNGLISFLENNSISDLKNIGAKTVQETEALIGKLGIDGHNSSQDIVNKEYTDLEKRIFENMSLDVDFLSVDALVELGLSKKIVSSFIDNNIKCCQGLRNLSTKELSMIIGKRYIDRLTAVATLLEQDLMSLLKYVLDSSRLSREYKIFLRRARGETLQEIADNPGPQESSITRERVRQIERKYMKGILPFVRELLFILKGSNNCIGVQDILDIFDDDEYDQILLYVSKSCDEFEYLDFADMFVDRNQEYSVEEKLLELLKDFVADGTDLSENREDLETALAETKLDYLDKNSIINLLKKNNYTFYGDFVVKGKATYAQACMHIIRTKFIDGIKLSQSESEQSEDLITLRRIISEKYKGLSVPASDRALSSTLIRNGLILRGRGLYIPQENITLDEDLLSEIKNFIDESDTNKVFYNEIYSNFEGALNFMCGIDNYNYLHGVLAMRYPDSYEYNRDYLLKNGVKDEHADSIADRIYAFICRMGRPVSKKELFQEFRGFSNIMLIMPFVNDSRLLQWEYNYYSCTGILDITEEDLLVLNKCLCELFEENNGYASDGLLYEKTLDRCPDFLEKNHISSEMNLHYIVAKMFDSTMDFKRPHISKKNRINLLSTKNVVMYLMNYPDRFTYQQYISLCDKMKWSRVTASAVLADIEEDYARLSIDEYIKNELLVVSESTVSELNSLIADKIENGVLSLINIDLEGFPDWEYPWDEFILETVIKKELSDYEVIQPIMKDRRYQRGIIVRKEENINSYAQIIAKRMTETGNHKMSESQFLSFLVVNNLARMAIPNELTNSEYIRKDGEFYCTII